MASRYLRCGHAEGGSRKDCPRRDHQEPRSTNPNHRSAERGRSTHPETLGQTTGLRDCLLYTSDAADDM
eukprot:13044543-Alexandrium_andersonii.AAC.1